MSIYDDLVPVATEVLKEFNQPELSYVELVPATDGTPFDPGEPTPVVHPIIGGVARGVEFKYVDGSQVVASDGQITCSVRQSFTPDIKDYVDVGKQRCKIKRATGLPPTTPVVYIIIYER